MADFDDLDALVADDGLSRLSPEEFDGLPFGSILLDRRGLVVRYNATEADIARRDATATIGKSFFEEIAPCTNTTAFRGRLEGILKAGQKTARVDYRFKFPWGARDVRIQLWVPSVDEQWIFVLPLR